MNAHEKTQRQYPWKRRWIERGLTPSESSSAHSAAKRFMSESGYPDTDDLIDSVPGEKPCLVMLGEPGIGKTTAVLELIEIAENDVFNAANQIMHVDLRSIGSEERLERKIFQTKEFIEWEQGKYHLYLFLDSLDECLLRVDTAARILLDELQNYPVKRMSLRIVCRTADWPSSFERGLRNLWDEDSVYVYELSPLQPEDIAIAAAAESIDADSFLTAVKRVSAMPFAVNPITLGFLLDIYAKEQRLPSAKREIYRRGCQILCEEPDEDRNRLLSTTANARYQFAKRMAYVTIFGNKHAIWDAPDHGDVPSEDVKLSDLIGENITLQDMREALNTGLFRSRASRTLGLSRFGWAHQSYAEFLAAEYVIDKKLSNPQILSIVTSGDEMIIPQLKETYAWLADRHPELNYDLVIRDPSILAEIDNVPIPPGKESEVTAKLLKLFDEQKLLDDDWTFRNSYHNLKHPDLAEQLRIYIVDKNRNFVVRRVATDIAEACEVRSLQEDLLTVSTDSDDELHIRTNAAYALWRLGDSRTKARMKPLAMDDGLEDPQDELKGCALLCIWPEHLAANELFSILGLPKTPNFLGSYRLFLHRFVENLGPVDLPIALEWCKGYIPSSRKFEDSSITMRDVVDNIMWKAWEYLDKPEVLETFSQIALTRIRNFEEIIEPGILGKPNLSEKSFQQKTRNDVTKRRKLTTMLMEEILSSEIDAARLIHPGYLITEEDLDWLFEESRVAFSIEMKSAYLELATRIFNRQRIDHIESAYEACLHNQAVKESFKTVFGPIEYHSPEAEKMREQYRFWSELQSERSLDEPEQKLIDPPPDERVRAFLTECEAGASEKWWNVAFWMVIDSTGHLTNFADLDYDLTRATQWANLTDIDQRRVVVAANQYLLQQKPEPPDWLEQPQTIFRPVLAGYKALWLLLTQDQAAFLDLPPEVWRTWTPVIVSYGDILVGVPAVDEKDWKSIHKRLVRIVYEAAPDIVIDTLMRLIKRRENSELPTFIFWEFEDCWDENLRSALFRKLQDPSLSSACYQELFDELLKHNSTEAWKIASASLNVSFVDEQQRRRAENTAYSLIQLKPAESWSWIWPTLQKDERFAHNLIARLSGRHPNYALLLGEKLSLNQLKALFIWLETHYPRAEDPDLLALGFHKITDREEIGRFRSEIFRQITLKSSLETLDTIEDLMRIFPAEDWMNWELIRARKHVKNASRNTYTIHELLELAGNTQRRLIQTGNELLELILESLDRLQKQLQHQETPTARFLWNELENGTFRPKSEDDFSDYVKVFLEDDLRRKGIVINREVQVRRGTGSETGQRTDIYVSAIRDLANSASYDALTVVVEVKCCWNDELNIAMKKQLCDRYLRANGYEYGVYLVGWFNSDKWANENRKKTCGKTSLGDLRSHYKQQSQELSNENLVIETYVMDVSF